MPPDKEEQWEQWRESLTELKDFAIPRLYTKVSPTEAQHKELCIVSDASEKAIAAFAYLKISDAERNHHTGFVFGKARLAPRPEQTIPRLELCAAVMAVNVAGFITSEIDIEFDAGTFYTDSKVTRNGDATFMSTIRSRGSGGRHSHNKGIMCHQNIIQQIMLLSLSLQPILKPPPGSLGHSSYVRW